jgi:hypothetical protein
VVEYILDAVSLSEGAGHPAVLDALKAASRGRRGRRRTICDVCDLLLARIGGE